MLKLFTKIFFENLQQSTNLFIILIDIKFPGKTLTLMPVLHPEVTCYKQPANSGTSCCYRVQARKSRGQHRLRHRGGFLG